MQELPLLLLPASLLLKTFSSCVYYLFTFINKYINIYVKKIFYGKSIYVKFFLCNYFQEEERQVMADQSYEIDIEDGHDDDEMQIDNDTGPVTRRGRGFGGNMGDSQLHSGRSGKFGNSTSRAPGPATAVRCTSLLHV